MVKGSMIIVFRVMTMLKMVNHNLKKSVHLKILVLFLENIIMLSLVLSLMSKRLLNMVMALKS